MPKDGMPNNPIPGKPVTMPRQPSEGAGELTTWKKRWKHAEAVREQWEKNCRTNTCYSYWKGDFPSPTDEFGQRKAYVNKIAPEVKNQIPSLYFYRPFARIRPKMELADTPGSKLSEARQLLQDTANHLIRQERTRFRPSTFLALKESFWAMGTVEVGYSANFTDDPGAQRPPLKEDEKTDIGKGKIDLDLDNMSDEEIEMEIERLQGTLTSEQFYVKHIPANQMMVSPSDKPILEDNDWIGYWEDVPLEDIKKAGKQGIYENTKNLSAVGMESEEDVGSRQKKEEQVELDKKFGGVERIRIYKVWDLRRKVKLVWAEGHPKFLMMKPFKRCPLFPLRFDVDPYHFWPVPPLLNKLGPQDEYNASREMLRKYRQSVIPKFTYDEDGVDAEEMEKLKKGIINIFIPRRAGTHGVIEPVQQPSLSEHTLQTLTLSDKEFADAGGVGGDAQVAQSKTATQAKIKEVKEQVQEGWDRATVATWLGEITEELLMLAIDNMLIDQWVAMNVAPDSPMAPQAAMEVQQQFQMITAQKLQQAASGIEFDLDIDIESLSPVTEEERFQKLMQALSFIANPETMKVFAVAPVLLELVMKYLGIRDAQEVEGIKGALQKLVEIQLQQAQMGAKPGPGVSPQPGGKQPGPGPQNTGAPSAPGPPATPGGPQPGGPQGGSAPKQ